MDVATPLVSPLGIGPLCAFGASVTWAVGSAGYSRLARGHSPFAVNFGRAMVGLPLFAIAVMLTSGGPFAAYSKLVSTPGSQLGLLAISIFASYGLGDVLFMWSTRSLGVPAALAIASTYPLLTAGLGSWLQGEVLAPSQVFGLVMTVTGIVIVILSGSEPTPPSSEGAHASPSHVNRRAVGILLAFGTMLMWAINSSVTARAGKDLDPFVANFIRMTFALGMSTGLSRILAPGTEIVLPLRIFKKSLLLFVFEAFGGSLLFIYGLSHSPLAIGSTLSSLAPVLSVPVAWALGLERFSFFRTIGVIVVVVGLWFLVGALE